MEGLSFAIPLALIFCLASASLVQSVCLELEANDTLSVTVKCRRNDKGKLVIEFNAQGEADEKGEGMVLRINSSLINCNQVEMLNLQGSLDWEDQQKPGNQSDVQLQELVSDEVLRFNEKTDRHVELSNGFRTAKKKKAWEVFMGGKVITNRALKDNETFSVVLEELQPRWSGSIIFGVTNISPSEIDFYEECIHYTCGMWVHNDYDNELQVGAILSGKRISNGTYQIFANSVLQKSFDDVPPTVYGFVYLYGQAEKVSIVSP